MQSRDDVSASFDKGVLEVTVARKEAPDPVLVAVPLALGLALLFEGCKWLVRRRR